MTTKGAHYIELLDDARCKGDWASVPELVRKTRKHAPERECLALTAETECAISKATGPSSAETSGLDVATISPKLLAAIENEKLHPEDKFQARVCVGWLHWVFADYEYALRNLPRSLEEGNANLDPAQTNSEWTNVCAMKSAYMRANCLTRKQDKLGALSAFQSGVSSLARVWNAHDVRKQLRYWAELFLTEYCTLSSKAYKEAEISLEEANSLSCFRSWGKFWNTMSGSHVGGHGFKGSVPRRQVWYEYYVALSRILEEDLPYPVGHLDKVPTEAAARAQLRQELKTTEATYQELLLGETLFPRADEDRDEVESFIRLVARNWTILCGRGWREQDLGPGGRAGISRGVLDILYAAATKTYHSTSILRFLFQVNLSVAEFDLAFKAFDSYMELINKGKARVDKTGVPEPSLDDDGTVLETMSQCILALCSYGHQHAAERARRLGGELEDRLAKLPQFKSGVTTPSIAEVDSAARPDLRSVVPPYVFALTWQAIGVAHAHWSRITSEASSRTEIQSKAIRCLRRSLASEFGRARDVNSLFSLGLLLAERRELTTAIEVVRTALMSTRGQEEEYHLINGPYWQERALIPMWHLLALLLSARQDYAAAARACEGALEQFRDPSVLFGKDLASFRSEHLNESDPEKPVPKPRGLVDDMDDAERESILEVKMTQLALLELKEGPEVAVNASYELLTLFSRLFGDLTVQRAAATPRSSEPPKTSGTLKTIRGSIFGGKGRPSSKRSSIHESTASIASRPATAQTSTGGAPSIQITEEDGVSRPPVSQRNWSSAQRNRSLSRRRGSLQKHQPQESQSSKISATTSNISNEATVVDGEPFFTPTAEADQNDLFTFAGKRPSQSLSSFSKPGKHLPSFKSFTSNNSTFSDFSEEGTNSSSYQLPLVQLPKDKEKFTRATILVRIWLMIAGFYRKADMLEDCKGALQEAQKLVLALESDAARDPSSATGPHRAGWAERKSVEDLWGDVWSEFGYLAFANETPYAARSDFETALTYCPDHPSATVGLSTILLDIYDEKLLPNPSLPPLTDVAPSYTAEPASATADKRAPVRTLPSEPLGLCPSLPLPTPKGANTAHATGLPPDSNEFAPPYKATRLPLTDRLAARDRAYALLTGLTRLGSGWNYSEAWFTLARAYEESGQDEKAKDVLWWCVELEEAMGVRDWRCLSGGGYSI